MRVLCTVSSWRGGKRAARVHTQNCFDLYSRPSSLVCFMRELTGECPNTMAVTRMRGTVGQPGHAAEGAGQSDRESLPSVP